MSWLKWLRGSVLRSQFPLLRLKGIQNYRTLSAISIMMLGVLVLLGAKARGLLSCSNVAEGFWVFVGVLWGFLLWLGLCVCFFSCFSSFLPFLFLHPFVYFLYAHGHLHFFIKFLYLYIKKNGMVIPF
jgi:hypothetical protein